MLPVGARCRRNVRDHRLCRWCDPWCLRVRWRRRMGRNAWCSVLAGSSRPSPLLEKRGSGDRARVWCSLSACRAGGAIATVGGVAGAFLGLRVSVGGAGCVGTHGVPCWSSALALHYSSGNVGVAIGLVSGAPCRLVSPEEDAGPSVVSLVRSLDSECLWAAPDGSERMVFRVGWRLSPFVAPREMWERR